MSSLKLTYAPDPLDDFSRLLIEAHSKALSGRGSCWASQVELQAFCDRLETFPITDAEPIVLSCGLNELAGDDLLCRLVLRPADPRGNLLLEAEIAEDMDDRWPRVRLKFRTNYTDVARFRQAVAAMLAGNKACAKLEGYG